MSLATPSPPLCALALAAAVALGTTEGRADAPRGRINAAHRLFQKRQFDRAAARLRALIPTLRRPADLRDAWLILGASALLGGDRDRAERHVIEALSHDPTYQPDPVLFAPDVQAFVRMVAVKRRDEIERRAAARSPGPSTRPTSMPERASPGAGAGPLRVRLEPVESARPATPWYVAVLPFGIGQLLNGQRTKGWVLLGVEVALLGTSAASLGAALGLRNERGNYREEDADTARTLNVVYLAAAYAALAVMAYGAIDGLLHRRPRAPSSKAPSSPTGWFGPFPPRAQTFR